MGWNKNQFINIRENVICLSLYAMTQCQAIDCFITPLFTVTI